MEFILYGVVIIIFHYGLISAEVLKLLLIEFMKKFLIFSTIVLFLGMCTVTENDEFHTKVNLGTFSGRENPHWLLTQQEMLKLRDLVDNLPSTSKSTINSGFPPYNGFLIEKVSLIKDVETIFVYKGNIILLGKGEREIAYLLDNEYQVEYYLFQIAEKHIDSKIYQLSLNEFKNITQ